MMRRNRKLILVGGILAAAGIGFFLLRRGSGIVTDGTVTIARRVGEVVGYTETGKPIVYDPAKATRGRG